MSERMTDERLAYFERLVPTKGDNWHKELWQALNAERLVLKSREAARAQYLEEKLALESQLEAVRGLLPILRQHLKPHTYASENTDTYRAYENGGNFVIDRIEAALKETEGD